MLELLNGPDDPLDRDHFDPGHFTVGAYAIREGSVAMVHHRRLGIWIEPGGHIDAADATMEDAAARELFEETGVVGQLGPGGIFDIDVHNIPAAKGEPDHKHYNVTFLFTAFSNRIVVADEVLDARWVPFGEVAELTTDPAVARAVGKLLELDGEPGGPSS